MLLLLLLLIVVVEAIETALGKYKSQLSSSIPLVLLSLLVLTLLLLLLLLALSKDVVEDLVEVDRVVELVERFSKRSKLPVNFSKLASRLIVWTWR